MNCFKNDGFMIFVWYQSSESLLGSMQSSFHHSSFVFAFLAKLAGGSAAKEASLPFLVFTLLRAALLHHFSCNFLTSLCSWTWDFRLEVESTLLGFLLAILFSVWTGWLSSYYKKKSLKKRWKWLWILLWVVWVATNTTEKALPTRCALLYDSRVQQYQSLFPSPQRVNSNHHFLGLSQWSNFSCCC